MTLFMALEGVTSFLRLKDVINTCKRMRRGLSIGGSSSVHRRKVGRSWSSNLFSSFIVQYNRNRSAPVLDLSRFWQLR